MDDIKNILINKSNELGLKEIALKEVQSYLKGEYELQEKDFRGFSREEIKPIFDRFEFHIEDRLFGSRIITRVGLYVDEPNRSFLNDIDRIGYYELETDYTGKIQDDYFIIEREKYLKDIGIISHLQHLNEIMPINYLKRNHLQYEYVTYINFVTSLFLSKNFEGAGVFISRAYSYLSKVDNSKIEKEYLKRSKQLLKMIESYLLDKNLLTEEIKDRIHTNKNVG